MNRRDFLKAGIAGALALAGCGPIKGRVGIALGGGGAKGLAHIPMLEVLDELGIRPHRIAGTSIGAVIGTLYAAGLTGRTLREQVARLTVNDGESWLGNLMKKDVAHWWDLIEVQLGRGGLLDTEPVAAFVQKMANASDFRDLTIPLRIVAADFWSRQQVVFDRGDLSPALQASIALPGLFSPLQHQGRVLVDGGLVNPVPYDLLFDDCDVVIAVDVSGHRTPNADDGPSYAETVFNTYQILQASIVREKLGHQPPHIYIKPALDNIRVLDFNRADEIYAQSAAARLQLERALR